jgi:chromosome segregation ATPase
MAVTERDLLALRLALVEAEVKKLRAAATSIEEAAERAKTAASATETAAWDATRAAARKKAALEARVSELERDLGMATTDLSTTGRQFSQVTNQLQVATEEAAELRDSNAKLSQDLYGKSHVLTPKFGKESDLWVQLDEESVWRKEGFLRCIRQKDPRSAICFRSAREQLS